MRTLLRQIGEAGQAATKLRPRLLPLQAGMLALRVLPYPAQGQCRKTGRHRPPRPHLPRRPKYQADGVQQPQPPRRLPVFHRLPHRQPHQAGGHHPRQHRKRRPGAGAHPRLLLHRRWQIPARLRAGVCLRLHRSNRRRIGLAPQHHPRPLPPMISGASFQNRMWSIGHAVVLVVPLRHRPLRLPRRRHHHRLRQRTQRSQLPARQAPRHRAQRQQQPVVRALPRWRKPQASIWPSCNRARRKRWAKPEVCCCG